MRKLAQRIVDVFWLGCIVLVLVSMGACASLPKGLPTPAQVASIADDAEGVLDLVSQMRANADAALPLVCASDADACEQMIRGLDRTVDALERARNAVAVFRKTGVGAVEVVSAVRDAVQEARALAK